MAKVIEFVHRSMTGIDAAMALGRLAWTFAYSQDGIVERIGRQPVAAKSDAINLYCQLARLASAVRRQQDCEQRRGIGLSPSERPRQLHVEVDHGHDH